MAAVPVGGVTGHEVAATPDGRTAFVPIYGNSGVAKPGTDGSTMAVIDIPSRKVTSTVDFGHAVRPHCPIYDPVSKMLYVTTELDKTITIIDPKTLKIVGTIPTGEAYSHMFAISHDGKRGYTANVLPGTVSVLDMNARKTLAIIPISPETQRISISRDDKMVFTADQTKPQLAVIDTATDTIKTWIDIPGKGYGTAPTLDNRWLLVTIPHEREVAIVDLQTLKVAKTIEVPAAPQEVLINPNGKEAYVSCNVKNQVAVIDLNQWKVKSLIDAGKTADGLAWAK
jgi:DNA-binding beta-propeller fold protein YncE